MLRDYQVLTLLIKHSISNYLRTLFSKGIDAPNAFFFLQKMEKANLFKVGFHLSL